MNVEDYISPRVAKLLKERKYDKECNIYYTGEQMYVLSTKVHPSDLSSIDYPAYKLYDVQKWLREVRNIHITVGNSASGYWWELSKADDGTMIYDYIYSGPNDAGKWDTYEETLDSAIFVALKYE